MSEIVKKEQEEEVVKVMRRVEKIILTPEGDFENVNLKLLQSMHADMNFLINSLTRYMNMLEKIKDFKDLWDCIKNKGDYLTVFKIYIAKIHGETFPHDDIPF